jgi:hypothetical protein
VTKVTIGEDIMEMRLPSLRRLSVNGVMWEVGDVLEFLFNLVHFSDTVD